jgi:translation initiation factor 1
MGLVYSTGEGRMCPGCGKPVAACACRRAALVPAGDGIVRVRLETQGRRGKVVTVIVGIPAAPDQLEDLASRLKRRCGSGGSVKAGVIEIQGDQRETVLAELAQAGYSVRRDGS